MDNIVRRDLASIGALSGPRSRLGVRVAPLAVAGLIAAINLATPTADYFWDGITFALQIEKVAAGEARLSLLFHQNHLLYNALGYLLYMGTQGIGLSLRALMLLQTANMLLGAAAIAIFFKCAERFTRSNRVALASSIALAFCASWWKLATDANAYIPAVFLLLLCFNNLTGPRPRWYIAGLWLALAMLMHELSSLFCLAALASVVLNRAIERRIRFSILMTLMAWGLTIITYYTCALLLHGLFSPFEVVRWAASNPSRVPMVWNPLHGILTTPNALFSSIVGHRFALFYSQRQRAAWIIGSAIVILIAASLLAVFRRLEYRRLREYLAFSKLNGEDRARQAFRICAAWLLPYLIFRCFFEPQDPYHRLFSLPALAIVVAVCVASPLEAISKGKIARLRRFAILTPLALGLFNFTFYILPDMASNSNRLVETARATQSTWDENTVVYFAGHNEVDTTFQYFNPKTKWRKLSPTQIASLEDVAAAASVPGADVWLNRGALNLISDTWLRQHASPTEIMLDAGYAEVRYVRLKPPDHTGE